MRGRRRGWARQSSARSADRSGLVWSGLVWFGGDRAHERGRNGHDENLAEYEQGQVTTPLVGTTALTRLLERADHQ
jgi:hypothetical protein